MSWEFLCLSPFTFPHNVSGIFWRAKFSPWDHMNKWITDAHLQGFKPAFVQRLTSIHQADLQIGWLGVSLKAILINSLPYSTTGLQLQCCQAITPAVGFTIVVTLLRWKTKSLFPLVHRVKGKQKGKAECKYKYTSKIWSDSSTFKIPKKERREKQNKNNILSSVWAKLLWKNYCTQTECVFTIMYGKP